MANLLRLIVACVAVFFAGASWATFSVPTVAQYIANYGGTNYYGSSIVEACTNAATAKGDTYVSNNGSYLCTYANAGQGYFSSTMVAGACPANSTAVNSNGDSACNCASGYSESTTGGVTTCVAAQTPTQKYCQENIGASDVSRVLTSKSSTALTSACVPTIYEGDQGCTSSWKETLAVKQADGTWEHRGTSTITDGSTCNLVVGATGSDPQGTTVDSAAPIATEAPCPNGQQGTVNGVTACIPYSTSNGVVSTSSPTTETTTNADGSTVKATSTNATACDGAGVCNITTTTTTTNTSSSGTVTSGTTSTTTQTSKSTYCATTAGKSDSACSGTVSGSGDDSTFTGTCASDFQCTGDAVECATARASWKSYCEVSTLTDAIKSGLAAEMAKAGTSQAASSALDAGTTNIGPSAFDTSDAIGGASCSIDKTVVMFGRNVDMPLSRICPYLSYMGSAFVAVALVAAALIVFKT